MRRNHNQYGTSLLELLVGLAIMGLTLAIALPDLVAANRRLAMRTGAARLTFLLKSVHDRAVSMNRNTAIRFTQQQGTWLYGVYEDTNGNGVSIADIAAGVDTRLEGPAPVYQHTAFSWLGFPEGGVTDPDTGIPFKPGQTAVAFGVLKLGSFSPQDGATPGTIYLTDGVTTAAIRCSSEGEIHTLWFDAKARRWLQ